MADLSSDWSQVKKILKYILQLKVVIWHGWMGMQLVGTGVTPGFGASPGAW